MSEAETITANMRSRAQRCRRLAAAITDDRARQTLEKMAEEIEADLARLTGGSRDTGPDE